MAWLRAAAITGDPLSVVGQLGARRAVGVLARAALAQRHHSAYRRRDDHCPGSSFTWVFNRTRGTVLLLMLLHAMNNRMGCWNALFSAADATRQGVLLAAGWCLVAVVVVLVAGPTSLSRRQPTGAPRRDRTGTARLVPAPIGRHTRTFRWGRRAFGGLVSTATVGACWRALRSTWVIAHYGPQSIGGEPWSLRGNGAQVVPLGIGPAPGGRLVGGGAALSIGSPMAGAEHRRNACRHGLRASRNCGARRVRVRRPVGFGLAPIGRDRLVLPPGS